MALQTPEILVTDRHLEDAREAVLGEDSPVLSTEIYRDEQLSAEYDAEIYVVSELHQVIGGYKIRGVTNSIVNDPAVAGAKSLVAGSAGTHGLAVAYLATREGKHADIFVPEDTPEQKLLRIQAQGGEYVTLHRGGDTVDEALQRARHHAAKKGGAFIHPFDSKYVIAGQGTLGLELADRLPDVDEVVSPVGGGGVASGVLLALQCALSRARLVAAEPAGAPSLRHALETGGPNALPGAIDPFVDGAAVRTIGVLPYSILSTVLTTDDCVAVDNMSLRRTVTQEWKKGNHAELAGCLSLAALKTLAERGELAGKTVACLVTGGNLGKGRYHREVALS